MPVVAIDTETRLITYPDEVNPKGVCLSVYDDKESEVYLLNTQRAKEIIEVYLKNPGVKLVGHNIAFDLHVILKEYPDLTPAVWHAMECGRIEDTMYRHKLWLLSTDGDCNKDSSLAACAGRWCDIELGGKEGDDIWRLRYGELEDVPVEDWPQEAYDYAAYDAEVTWLVYQAQEKERTSGPDPWHTRHLQVIAGYCLRQMEIDGICIDQQVVGKIKKEYTKKYDHAVKVLKEHGLLRASGSRNMQAIRDLLERLGVTETTDTGAIKTDRKTLEGVQSDDPAFQALLEYSNTLKAVTTFVPQMEVKRVHPRFNVMVNTMRTSCSASNYYKRNDPKPPKRLSTVPSINFQQIPRDPIFRSAFIPDDGKIFICADYSNLELVCTAQFLYETFGENYMQQVLNEGRNFHDVTGHAIYNDKHNTDISFSDYCQLLLDKDPEAKFCRQAAKPVNLGIPGGQVPATIQRNAKGMYKIDITMEQAEGWYNILVRNCPELRAMFTCYLPTLLNGGHRWNKDRGRLDPLYNVQVCGTTLANKTYCAAANCVSMQSRAAVGAKIAMGMILKDIQTNKDSPLFGAKMHALVHDEFLISVYKSWEESARDRLAYLMIEGMRKVCPDVAVGCEAMIMSRWGKDSDNTKEY